MKRWDLHSLLPSTEKRTPRQPGPDAPRVPRTGRQIPRVLFSSPECRIIAVDLLAEEEMGDHRVRERALLHVVTGRVSIESSGTTAECPAGTLVVFEPGERHRLYALTDARLLLVLAPWPAPDHFPEHVPANAVAGSLPPNDRSTPPDRA
ncbi:MAG: hypothetical protein ACRDLZ_07505 [Gaiellaceae bacterium]